MANFEGNSFKMLIEARALDNGLSDGDDSFITCGLARG